MSGIECITVGEHTIEAFVGADDTVWVIVRRVCEVLGIDRATQQQRLLSQAWSKEHVRVMPVEDRRGVEQDNMVISLDGLPMWLAGINAQRTRTETRAALELFQREACTVLATYFGRWRASPPPPMRMPDASSSGARLGGALHSTGATMVPSKPSGGASLALQQLAIVDALTAAIRAQDADIQAVRAEAQEAKAAAADAVITVQDMADTVEALRKNTTVARESRRQCRAAVAHITRAVQRWCTQSGHDYRRTYSDLRTHLGLRSVAGKRIPPLGQLDLRADQIIRLARRATEHGVLGCSPREVNDILNADLDITRDGAITVEPEGVVQ